MFRAVGHAARRTLCMQRRTARPRLPTSRAWKSTFSGANSSNRLRQSRSIQNKTQRRNMSSFFDELKKGLKEELDKNKELKDATEKLQQSFSNVGKTVDKEAARTADAARKAAAQSTEAAKQAAAAAKKAAESAAGETTKQAEEAASSAGSALNDKLGGATKSVKTQVENLKSRFSDVFSSTKKTVEKQAQQVKEQAAEGIESLKSSEEFKEVGKEFSKARETLKEKSPLGSFGEGKDAAPGTSVFSVVRDTATQALGETSWSEEFRNLFKPEKKIKKIKLAGVADQEKKKNRQPTDEEVQYDGPTELLTVAQPTTGWEAFSERLSNTPLIARLLEQSKEANKVISETEAGKAVKGTLDATKDMRDELRERWETSQNPWVYRISGLHDAFFAETETATAIGEVQRLDPTFELEEFLQALEEETIPHVIQAFVEGNNDKLRHVLSEGAYAMTYAAMKARLAEGHVMDPNVLHIEEPTLLLAQVMDKQPPVFLVRSLAHQVNCIRDRSGEITEGSPSEIRTVVYMMAFQQEVDDELNELAWKLVEFGVHPMEARAF